MSTMALSQASKNPRFLRLAQRLSATLSTFIQNTRPWTSWKIGMVGFGSIATRPLSGGEKMAWWSQPESDLAILKKTSIAGGKASDCAQRVNNRRLFALRIFGHANQTAGYASQKKAVVERSIPSVI